MKEKINNRYSEPVGQEVYVSKEEHEGSGSEGELIPATQLALNFDITRYKSEVQVKPKKKAVLTTHVHIELGNNKKK